MPFTPAHVAAVLPVRHRAVVARTGVWTALVAGSVAPDMSHLVPIGVTRAQTHTIPACFTISALIAVVMALGWERLFADPLRDLAPRWVRERVPPLPKAFGWRDLPVVYAAAVAGCLTHVVWDFFTHTGSPITNHVPLLMDQVGSLPVCGWLQLLSSVGGIGAVLLVYGRQLSTTAPVPEAGRHLPAGHRWRGAACLLVLLAAAFGGVVGAWGRTFGSSSMLNHVVARGVSGALAAAVLVALAWRGIDRPTSRGRPARADLRGRTCEGCRAMEADRPPLALAPGACQ